MTDEISRFAGIQVFGLSLANIAIAVAVALLSYMAMSVMLRLVLGRLEKIAAHTANHIGGVAVALAVQNILGDLFASLSIAVDKPFEVGHYIGVGSVEGTVQYVGLKTTRIQSISGEQIVMSNTDLLKRLNIKLMRELGVMGVEFAFPTRTVIVSNPKRLPGPENRSQVPANDDMQARRQPRSAEA